MEGKKFQCSLCMGDDFLLMNGLYYCSRCNTQSQEYHEEEAEDQFTEGFNYRLKIRSKTSNSKTEFDYGEKWTSYEAFNLIIKSQVDALISIGASSNLKEMVFLLWANYLIKLKVAFVKKPTGTFKVATNLRERDLTVNYKSNYKIGYRDPLAKLKPKKIKLSAKLKRLGRRPKIKPKFPIITINSGSSSDYNPSDESDEECVPRKKITQKKIFKDYKSKYSINNSIRTMTLPKTIAFIFLGLLIVKEKILLSDIIRWTWEGLIPYYQAATDVLPPEMIFQAADNRIFKALYPLTNEFVRLETGRLASFLEIQQLPYKSISNITARLIIDLELPLVMHRYVNNLVCIHHPEMKWEFNPKRRQSLRIPNYEGRAMALIIFTLKLLFGLNDNDEWKKSEYGRKLITDDYPEIFGERLPFLWSDWIKKINYKFELQSLSWQRKLRTVNCTTAIDVDALANYYANEGHNWRGRVCLNRLNIKHRENEDIWNALCEPFRQLLRDDFDVVKAPEINSSSFPLQFESNQILESCKITPDVDDTCYSGLNYLSAACNSEAINCDPHTVQNFQKGYRKYLKSYKRFSVNKYIEVGDVKSLSCVSEPLSKSFYQLLKLFANLVEMKQVTLYREYHLLENMIFRKNVNKRGNSTTFRMWSKCNYLAITVFLNLLA